MTTIARLIKFHETPNWYKIPSNTVKHLIGGALEPATQVFNHNLDHHTDCRCRSCRIDWAAANELGYFDCGGEG